MVHNARLLLNRQRHILILLVGVIFLLPFGRLSELPILILALGGAFKLVVTWSDIQQQSWFKPFSAVFFAYFLLAVISSFDSYWPDKSWLISLGSLRFYLAGIFVLYTADVKTMSKVMSLVTVIVVIWGLDACLQSLIGFNLLGQASYPGRLTGVFSDNVKLGPVLALLLPIVLIQLCGQKVHWRWLITALVIVVILLSGTRSAWLMMLFVLLVFWWHHVKGRRWLLLVKTGILVVMVAFTLWMSSQAFQQRIDRTLGLFQGDIEAIDYALADRLPIWKTALNMYQDHPINGVGARAFRVVYSEYAEAGDVWVAGEGSGLHAHHWVLEVLAETGTIGLLLMFGLMVIVITQVRNGFTQKHVWPYATALMAAMLPVVSLYSLFSSFWSICLWWLLIMLFLGLKHGVQNDQ